ncbi:MAG: hypothetical protein R3C56_30485 [Pirellulaceae bacterium]
MAEWSTRADEWLTDEYSTDEFSSSSDGGRQATLERRAALERGATLERQTLSVEQAISRAAAATVRIRVDEANTTAYGTGTIVDVRGQEALDGTAGTCSAK